MRSAYGSVNFMNWINGASDEYANLFAHANYLGLVGLWQWNPGPEDPANLELYCRTAWQNGWMTRVAQEPLPVQLTSFAARVSGANRVLLTWTTLSETNNYGFEVQRRPISTDTFSPVPNGFVPGAGTTLTPREYLFIDSTSGYGRWFYRLKQIDLDGAVSYSQVVEVAVLTGVGKSIEARGSLLNQNYPNPFNPSTTIDYSISTSRKVSLKVFDMLGREVDTVVEGLMPVGDHRATWNAGGQPSGVYILRLEAGDVVQTRKLVVLR
jgi:hypothetical protein